MLNEAGPAMAADPRMLKSDVCDGPARPDVVQEITGLMNEKRSLARELHNAKVQKIEMEKHIEVVRHRLGEVEKAIQKAAERYDAETNWQ